MRYFINDKKDYFFTASCIYLIGLLIFSLIGDRGLLTSLTLWGDKKQLEKDISVLETQIQTLEQEVYDFSHNDRKVYEYAREKFNMQQDNEIQYVFRKNE